MNDELPNLLPDVVAPTNRRESMAPSPRSPSASPPFADTVVRPFTSQGSTFGSPFRPLMQAPPSDRPLTARDSAVNPPHAMFSPYISASARTSYTRVDVDSLPTPVYPPLPPLPTAFAARDVDVSAPGVTTLPTTTVTVPDTLAYSHADETPIPQTPQVSLTFLLVSGLRKTQSFDPEATVGRVKELVWNAWPVRDADWEDERPPAPSYLRILYLGKILQDDDTLLHVGFPTSFPSASDTIPTIVHLSIRPYAPLSDDPALSKKRRLSVAIGRGLSTVTIGLGARGRDLERPTEDEARRAGCCTGCTIC